MCGGLAGQQVLLTGVVVAAGFGAGISFWLTP